MTDYADILHRVRNRAKSAFVKNVLLLMSGTTLAQVISISAAPLLLRIYDPAAFGIYGAFASITSIFGVISTLEYDQAIMLPRTEKRAANLLALSITSVSTVALLAAVIMWLFGKNIASLLGTPSLVRFLKLVPISILVTGMYETLKIWSTRRKHFRNISASQGFKGVAGNSAQYLAGLEGFGPLGLIAGYIIGDLVSILILLSNLIKKDAPCIVRSISFSRIRKVAREYSDFPVYSGTQSLLSSVSQNLPMLLLAHYFGVAVLGYYALALRVIQVPVNIVLTSTKQVFYQKACEVHNSGGSDLKLFIRTTAAMFGLALVPTVALIIFAPKIFAFALGVRWLNAGVYARWLVVWLCINFINFPAYVYAQIYRKQHVLLIQDICLLVFRSLALIIGGIYFNALTAVIAYSIVGLTFNIAIILWALCFLRSRSIEANCDSQINRLRFGES